MKFLLNQTPVYVQECEPDTTLLNYLRNQLGYVGTKEGCASGDCGACTVVLVEADAQGQLQYRAINSCITYLGRVNHCQVISVEGLSIEDVHDKGSDDERSDDERSDDKRASGYGSKPVLMLHPVQQSLVDAHASQCGFCTPGFVMSLFALWHQPLEVLQNSDFSALVMEALSGNLCRCTGYRPIIDAAKACLDERLQGRVRDQFDANALRVRDNLVQWTLTDTDPFVLGSSQASAFFAVPEDMTTLITLLQDFPQARLVAGATDLALETTQQYRALPQLIYLGHVAELKHISPRPDGLYLGASVTYVDAKNTLLTYFPALAGLLERLGSLQIRQQGTLGGNIVNASPIADMPPVLLALDARLLLRDSSGLQTVPFADFYRGYRQTCLPAGGVLESVLLPYLQLDSFLRIYKVSKRQDDDISAVFLALHVRIQAEKVVWVRLGYGGMAATPARAYKAEAALLGQPFTLNSIHAAQQALLSDFSPLSDVRASATYRNQVAANLLERAVREFQSGATLEVKAYA